LKLIFAGTPVFAERHLQALINSEHDVVAVYTQPDRPAGRGKKLVASPVKALAEQHQIPVIQPLNFRNQEDIDTLKALNADLMIVVAYGILLPKAILEAPRLGCLNVHGSILPRWRGAAPIQRAIEAGDTESGVTIMQMDEGLDTGDMLIKSHCPIHPNDSSAELHDRLAEIGPPALLEAISKIEDGSIQPEQQDDTQSNYAKKITKEEALIDWSEAAEIIHRKIRAFNPFPVCYSFLDGKRIKIYSARLDMSKPNNAAPGNISIDKGQLLAACSEGALIIQELQAPGKKKMDAAAFLNGLNHQLPADSFSNQ